MGSETEPMSILFASLGLEKYLTIFTKQEISLADLPRLGVADLEKLISPTGPRERLTTWIKDNPAIIQETRLSHAPSLVPSLISTPSPVSSSSESRMESLELQNKALQHEVSVLENEATLSKHNSIALKKKESFEEISKDFDALQQTYAGLVKDGEYA